MTDFDALLTKEDVCKILGVKESWLNIEIQTGRIPHIRLGKKKMVRFRPEHLDRYLESREYTNGEDATEDTA
jgi:excisionase family DNA binding protein